jgi:hypothetical protein
MKLRKPFIRWRGCASIFYWAFSCCITISYESPYDRYPFQVPKSIQCQGSGCRRQPHSIIRLKTFCLWYLRRTFYLPGTAQGQCHRAKSISPINNNNAQFSLWFVNDVSDRSDFNQRRSNHSPIPFRATEASSTSATPFTSATSRSLSFPPSALRF